MVSSLISCIAVLDGLIRLLHGAGRIPVRRRAMRHRLYSAATFPASP
jgi:hypothetical protein